MDLGYRVEQKEFCKEVRAFLAENWPPKGKETELSRAEQVYRFLEKATGAGCLLCLVLLAVQPNQVHAQQSTFHGEWRSYASDKANTKYTPLEQIDRDNVSKLSVLWRRPALDPGITERFPDLNPSNVLQATPLMIGGVLYTSNSVGLVEALDAGTGETLWIQEPLYEGFRGMAGRSTRGVAHWSSGSSQRIFSVRGDYLVSMSAETGSLVRDFGDGGKVNLKRDGPPEPFPAGGTSGPIVVGDVVIVGGGGAGSDFPVVKEGIPAEDVRAYDVRTGRLRWTFHVIPQPGEFGFETWEDDSWKIGGAIGAWPPLTVDEELGYVYLPLSSPMHSFYGGHRPGQTLFANSLVCIDAKTGERVWHYQLVHHDLWDYDPASAPVLGDITVDGKPIKAVMQLVKHGFLFVFDRVTGEPVWPIEERPVPPSTTPGERAWPTQPFPTKPAPFDRQGITVDDLIDFTPELRAEALEIVKSYVLGPLFTPPSVAADGHTQGTISVPSALGGANWNGGAFDPETGIFYVPSHTIPWVDDLVRPPALIEATTPYMHGPQAAGPLTSDSDCCAQYEISGPDGLPLVKPPYGRITAIDLSTGEHIWMAPNGDGPRNHPRLRHLNLPPLGQQGRPAPLLTKTLLFIGEGDPVIGGTPKGGGGNKLRAYDKATGDVVWETELTAGTTGAPMSYLWNGKQYIVVAIGGVDHPAQWVALDLP